jgi:hypothetical protein
MSDRITEPPQCKYPVYVRDTYRYTGGRARFKLHYARKQCSRRASEGDYCWQHKAIIFSGGTADG